MFKTARKRMPLISWALWQASGKFQKNGGKLKMQARPTMSLKTQVEKMSILSLATMLIKTKDLSCLSHDVDENKADAAILRSPLKRSSIENEVI